MAKLLLVDDDPILLTLLAKLLRHRGHTVSEAVSGEECLARATAEKFDLIMTDVMMPDMDGYQLTQQLRAHPAARDTAILIVTASLEGPDQEIARAAGADGYDVKTVNMSRLNETIESLLAARQASQIKTDGEQPLIHQVKSEEV